MQEYKLGKIVIHIESGRNIQAWVSGRDWFLSEDERALSPEELAIKISNEHQNGLFYRCSTCGMLMKANEVAGWPLFSGVACVTHWNEHKEKLKEERRAGHVCPRCGSVYSSCAC